MVGTTTAPLPTLPLLLLWRLAFRRRRPLRLQCRPVRQSALTHPGCGWLLQAGWLRLLRLALLSRLGWRGRLLRLPLLARLGWWRRLLWQTRLRRRARPWLQIVLPLRSDLTRLIAARIASVRVGLPQRALLGHDL